MQTTSDPKTARVQRDGIVETEHSDSNPTTCSQPDNLRTLLTPAKVCTPPITARIEQADEAAGVSIASTVYTLLELIAQGTAHTQILERRHAAGRLWDNVVQMKCCQGHLLWR
jgi:hypothetical protein